MLTNGLTAPHPGISVAQGLLLLYGMPLTFFMEFISFCCYSPVLLILLHDSDYPKQLFGDLKHHLERFSKPTRPVPSPSLPASLCLML